MNTEVILMIVCLVMTAAVLAMAIVILVKSAGKKNKGSNSEVLEELENTNNNLNEVKNLVNEHTTREKDNLANIFTTAFNASNNTLIPMLESYMKSFKATLDDNLKMTKEQLDNIRGEMKSATSMMRDDTTKSLSNMKEEINSSLKDVREDTGKVLTNMKGEINSSLKDMRADNEKQLASVRENNDKQLELMRNTVDEKLTSTLDSRIKNAFEMVNDRLDKVQQGFGEMKDLSTKVTNLNKVFSNVKTRGGWGEVALESLLDQILSPEQYKKQVQLSRSSQEAVDFVIVMPGHDGESVYLPIDSKFPLDKYTQLVEVSEEGDSEKIDKARKALIDEVKREAKSISSKYVKPPVTTNFAIMYLPTEGLYAEIIKDSVLTTMLQNEYKITVCGPTTITALLNSLQTGFTTLKIQKKSGEIVKELQRFRKDFERYTELITKIKRNARIVVDTVEDVEKKNEKIIGRLRKVGDELPSPVQEENLIEQVAETEEEA